MKIENQNIYGGNQQFADIIINSKENKLNEVDRKFIELIHKNTNSDDERIELIKSLETIKEESVVIQPPIIPTKIKKVMKILK